MADTRWSGWRLQRLRDTAGYSLVEMIMAIAIASIVGMGLYALFNSQQKFTTSQKLQIELQTNCGMALDQMKQELLQAGYRGEETPAQSFSAVNHKTGDATGRIFDQITFEYFDDKAKFNDAGLAGTPRYDPGIIFDSNYTESTQIRYELSGGNLIRNYARLDRGTETYTSAPPQILATNVQNLEFELFSDSGQLLDPISSATLDNIRNVGIKLTCQSPKVDKMTGRAPTVTLTASVKPRNVGLEANPRDTTPPAAPTNVAVWDPGICGELKMRWNANTDADLAGYTVYYGLSTGVYSNRARISRGPQAAGNYEEITLSDLSPTKYTDAAQATYRIVVTAYDKSSNQSAYSTPETSGVGATPSTRTFSAVATNGNDSTINLDPAPATTLTATGGAEGQINLSWAASTVTGLLGYRLYRGTSSSFVPDDTVSTGNLLADQAVLGPTATTWTDPGTDSHGPLKGCTSYYYKLAAIHCDTTIPTANLNFATATAMPTDNTPPPSPTLTARPGYKRIILSLTNPSQGAAPDFKETKIWYSKTGYPTLTNGISLDGTLIPDKDPYLPANTAGTFTAWSSIPTINFNSHDNGDPSYSNPELTGDATYYFIAVAYDQCGKNSAVTGQAKAEGAQCNDCLDASPGPPATAREACYDAPPAPENVRAEGCSGTLKITWDYPYLTQTEIYRDLTGFHVFRCEGWICPEGASTEVELTKAAGATKGDPTWQTFWEDGTVVEGQEYTYRIQATDCFYERRLEGALPGDNWALNTPLDNYRNTAIPGSGSIGLYTGRLLRQYWDIPVFTKLTAALTADATTVSVWSTVGFVGSGNSFKIDDEIIRYTGATDNSFTGCVRGESSTTATSHLAGADVFRYPPPPPWAALTGGLYLTPPDMHHNSVTITVQNTAGSLLASPTTRILTLNQLKASWENALAYLKSLIVGDNYTTPLKTSFTESPPLTKASAGSTIILESTPIDGGDTLVPMTTIFAHQNGSVDSATDMREDNLNLGLSWLNNSTNSQCPSPATAPTLVSVPLGPMIDNVTMDRPTAGTVALPVPGGGATANPMNVVVVPGGVTVNVFANVYDMSGAGIRQVQLYYFVDSGRTLEATPAVDTGASFPTLAPYTMVSMEYVAGSQWRTPAGSELPVSDDQNVWFFIVATDNHGNFDREPEIDSGAFQYYQQLYDVCATTPNPPGLSGSADSSGVTLTITKPTTNTDGSSYGDHVGYKIYRKLNNGAFAQVGSNIVTAATPYTWPTTPDAPANFNVLGNDYSYYAVAYDSCSPAKVSSASRIYTECMNAAPCNISITPSASPFVAGGSFEVDVTICSLGENATSGEYIWFQTCSGQGDADPVRLVEDGTSGAFRIDAAYYGGRSSVQTYATGYPSTPIDLDLLVNATDTVTIRGYSTSASAPTTPSDWNSTCQSAASMQCSASLAVSGPCVTPSAPQNLTAAPTLACNRNNNSVVLSWTAPATGTASFYRVYRCNAAAAAQGANCEPATLINTTASGAVLTYTDNLSSFIDTLSTMYWYTVKAVDSTCTPEGVSPAATKVSDTCGSN